MRKDEPAARTMNASEVRQRFSEVVNRVFRHEGRVPIEKSGIPVAAIVSPQDLERLERLDAHLQQRVDLLARMRAPSDGMPEERLTRDGAQVIADMHDEDEATLLAAEPPVTFDELFESIPPLSGRETVDLRDLVREAMEDRAAEVVRRLETR